MRENRNDLIRKRGTGLRTPLAPRPRRGGNIRKNGDPPLFRPRREPPIKVRIVDDDKHIRPLLLHEPCKVIEESKDTAQIEQHRRDPHNVVIYVILAQDDPRRRHLSPAEANKGNGGIQCTQFTCECSPVEITRGLPRRKHDFQVGKTSLYSLHCSNRNAVRLGERNRTLLVDEKGSLRLNDKCRCLCGDE